MQGATDILGLDRDALGRFLDEVGVGRVHASTVFSAVHRSDVALGELPELGARKGRLLKEASFSTRVTLERAQLSADGTEKLVFRFADGALTEGVLIPMPDGRITFCVSSQVGCAMGCGFCATATMGLVRGLTPGEIVAQVRAAKERLGPRKLDNIVFMGMGEPLHHYDATTTAIRILTDHRGLMQAQRSISVSTVGLVPRIRRLAEDFDGRVQLAVSLNAGTDATRARLMPQAARWSLAQLKAALLDYPLPGSSRHLLLEYVLLAGVNDTADELAGVLDFCAGLRCVVNLIPWNPVVGADFRTPEPQSVDNAFRTLANAGVMATVRRPRGRDVGAACGQLVLSVQEPS